MLRWLSRYVKQINVFGVGIELREISEEEALPLLALAIEEDSAPVQVPVPAEAASPPAVPPLVRRQDFIRVGGVSASSQRAPRELDLTLDGDEIEFHIHDPDGSQPKVWARRDALQKALDHWKDAGKTGPITVAGRTARKEAEVAFVVDSEDEVEVQAGWWIWVPRAELKEALKALGVRVPWQ